jgi:hypothetical protein
LCHLLDPNGPGFKTGHVTGTGSRARMAGNPILDTLHNAGRNTRVFALANVEAVEQWWNTAADKKHH